MNYRHAFHAGNFADVFKHAVLTRILVHLLAKDSAFRVIDTHAGSGRYDLTSDEATRGGEWRDGIAPLLAAAQTPSLGPAAAALLAPYLAAVTALNPPGEWRTYPGSPLVALAMLRRTDRLIACETEPQAMAALTQALQHDTCAKAIALDG